MIREKPEMADYINEWSVTEKSIRSCGATWIPI